MELPLPFAERFVGKLVPGADVPRDQGGRRHAQDDGNQTT